MKCEAGYRHRQLMIMTTNRDSSMKNGLTDPVTLTFDLLIQKHSTSSISQVNSLYQVKVWTLWDHSFL